MPINSAHGGHCCGIKHFFGFSGNHQADLRQLDSFLTLQYQKRTVEIVLTQNQCTNGQRNLLPALAERGFVMVSAFRNANSSNNCYIFHRVDLRHPMNDLPFNWTGQIMSPSLGGQLPEIPQRVLNQDTTPIGRCPDRGQLLDLTHFTNNSNYILVHIGDVLRYRGTNNVHLNETFVVLSRALTADNRVEVRKESTGVTHRLSVNSFEFVQRPPSPPAAPAEAPAPIPFPNQRFNENNPVEQAFAAPDPIVVASLYWNRYADGRQGALFPSLETAVAAAPRCRTRMVRSIFSDGTQTDQEAPQ